MKLKKILVMNGPNLDMLGTREPQIYGNDTLADLEAQVKAYADKLGIKVSFFQSNSEGKLIKKIHRAPEKNDAIVFNPGAHTHYSYALRDAIGSIDVPVVEVHLSNVDAREPFRAKSVVAPVCVAQIKGRGFQGYIDAIDLLRSASSTERLGEGYEERYPQGEVISAVACAAAEEKIVADDAVDESADVAGDGAGGTDPGADANDSSGAAESTPSVLAHSRLAKLRAACEQQELAGFVVRDTENIAWLSAIDGVFDEERAHALVVTVNEAALHTDSRYANACATAIDEAGLPITVNAQSMSHAAFAREFYSDDESVSLGIEDDISVRELRRLEQEFLETPVQLHETTNMVLGLRAVKDEEEITRMKAAQAITDAAFEHIVSFMRPGQTEREVQIELENFMVRNGAEGLAFSSIVATGANAANPHAIPGSTVLQEGQCVVLDFGARRAGYCSDMTRTVFLGEPDDEMRRAWEVLVRANETVQQLIKPGATGAAMHECAERVLEEGGFGGTMGHGLGHGVGRQVHELPSLSPRYREPLVVGNVVTVEPGIYLPGKFGMRLEDFGVVTHEGYERFTQSTHDMVIIKRL